MAQGNEKNGEYTRHGIERVKADTLSSKSAVGYLGRGNRSK